MTNINHYLEDSAVVEEDTIWFLSLLIDFYYFFKRLGYHLEQAVWQIGLNTVE